MPVTKPLGERARALVCLSPLSLARSAAAFGVAFSLLACSEAENSSGATSGAPDAGGEDAATGDPNVLVGGFQVRLIEPVPAMNGNPASPGSTSVLGKIYDGPTPSQIVWEASTKEGDCQVFTPRVPFCSTPCGGSAVCVEDDTCQAYPAAHSAGTIKATGIHTEAGDASFSMSPIANNYQPPASVKLLYPGFSEGETIRLEASGDYFKAFSVEAKGISQLVILNDMLPLETGKPLSLSWTPPGKPELSTIHVKLDISHHGGTKGMIECDAPDTGSLTLPAALVTELLNLGVAGFPTIIVSRSAKGSVTIAPGRVDLTVSSTVERSVQIPGVTSCTADTDCLQGQTCQNDLTCK